MVKNIFFIFKNPFSVIFVVVKHKQAGKQCEVRVAETHTQWL